jgi:serine/threonine protein kinase
MFLYNITSTLSSMIGYGSVQLDPKELETLADNIDCGWEPHVEIRDHVAKNENFYKEHFAKIIKLHDPDKTQTEVDTTVQIIFHKLIKKPIKNPQQPADVDKTTQQKTVINLYNKTIFENDNLLGRGGFKKAFAGQSYKLEYAENMPIKLVITPVALLRVKKNIPQTKAENLVADNFSSTHIIKKCESFDDHGEWVMIAERLPVFLNKVEVDPTITFTQLIRSLKGATKGMIEIHSHNHMHRDIKPGNLAIRYDGKGIVTDLGCTAPINSRPAFAGTLHYCPPELTNGTHLKNFAQNTQGDMWALGASLYKIFHPEKRHPIEASDRRDLLSKLKTIQDNPANFEDNLFNGWDTQGNQLILKLQDLIRNLLKVDPTKRLTAQEAYAALKEIETLSEEMEEMEWTQIDSTTETTS